MFAVGLLDVVDPPVVMKGDEEASERGEVTREEQLAEEEEEEDDDMDEREEKIRKEFLLMCHAFINQTTAQVCLPVCGLWVYVQCCERSRVFSRCRRT